MSSLRMNQFYKTKMCPWFFKGRCERGDTCRFAHSQQELRTLPDLEKTSLCPTVSKGLKCTSSDCRYAHTVAELRATDDLYKTSLCFMWMRGHCDAGEFCRHAHGNHELRTVPSSTESTTTTASEQVTPPSSPRVGVEVEDSENRRRQSISCVPTGKKNMSRGKSRNIYDPPASSTIAQCGSLSSEATTAFPDSRRLSTPSTDFDNDDTFVSEVPKCLDHTQNNLDGHPIRSGKSKASSKSTSSNEDRKTTFKLNADAPAWVPPMGEVPVPMVEQDTIANGCEAVHDCAQPNARPRGYQGHVASALGSPPGLNAKNMTKGSTSLSAALLEALLTYYKAEDAEPRQNMPTPTNLAADSFNEANCISGSTSRPVDMPVAPSPCITPPRSRSVRNNDDDDSTLHMDLAMTLFSTRDRGDGHFINDLCHDDAGKSDDVKLPSPDAGACTDNIIDGIDGLWWSSEAAAPSPNFFTFNSPLTTIDKRMEADGGLGFHYDAFRNLTMPSSSENLYINDNVSRTEPARFPPEANMMTHIGADNFDDNDANDTENDGWMEFGAFESRDVHLGLFRNGLRNAYRRL
eukprot:GHVO01047881.1.p1 GENE.GHVO01047881.1~~GHVO01047881.1.p1  ORF type:complete len:576 (+),score=35.85 GHVO01047881.1:103-1830(+)